MKTHITFGDLAHREHTAKVVPLGIAMVAAYALKHFEDQIEAEVFKSADDFIHSVEKKMPRIACFTNYIWTENLSYQIASRMKKKNPETIIIWGGPNYMLYDQHEQKKFLSTHPDIDFYIVGEGEVPFVLLLKEIFKYNLDIDKIKKERLKIPGCHYLIDDEFISSPMPPTIKNLDEIPSPYLLGLCDKLLDGAVKPLMETARGCPFSCTFCQQGEDYYNKVRRFSQKRIKDEILYLAEKSKSKTVCLADSNFGTYKQDIEVCKVMAQTSKTHGFPMALEGINGKNKPERVLEATQIIGHTFFMAAIQSSNDDVLKNIKRKNISGQAMLDVVNKAKERAQTSTSFSELIIGLPGETKESHFKSNGDLLDAGIDVVRSHQLIMLPASPLAYRESRIKHGLVCKYRVVPETVDAYKIFGEEFYAPEIDEICVANKTLSFDDYVECRKFDLTIETFYNNGIFEDLINLLKKHGVKISSFVFNVHEKVKNSELFAKLYGDFERETKELWETREDLIDFLKDEKIIKKYLATEMGNNEQLLYRTVGILEMIEQLHKVTFEVAKSMLKFKMNLNGETQDFFKEFESFSLMQKQDMISTDKTIKKVFHYDFISLIESGFKKDPKEKYVPEGIEFEFSHTSRQKAIMNDYFNIYGNSKNSLAFILTTACQNDKIYRAASYTQKPLSWYKNQSENKELNR